MPPSNPKSKASSSSTATNLSQGVYPLHLAPPTGPFHIGSGLLYAHFQPILGTQKCFPRDFRDQFSIFPKISWIGGLFFKIVSRILGGAKGRFCPVAGGVVALCCVLCPVALCPVSLSGSARRRQAKTGPARCRSLRPPIWPGLVGYMGIFSPAGFSARPGLWFAL